MAYDFGDYTLVSPSIRWPSELVVPSMMNIRTAVVGFRGQEDVIKYAADVRYDDDRRDLTSGHPENLDNLSTRLRDYVPKPETLSKGKRTGTQREPVTKFVEDQILRKMGSLFDYIKLLGVPTQNENYDTVVSLLKAAVLATSVGYYPELSDRLDSLAEKQTV